MLELTKLSKILQRLTKKATTDVKTLAQTVLDNAVAASAKKKAGSAKSDNPASPNSAGSPADGGRKDLVTGMKRPREGDAASQSAPKKVSKVSSKPLALQNAERRKALEMAQAAKAGEKPANGAQGAGAGTAAKTKIAVAAPPKQSVFSSLMSASKKPGTSLAARAAAAVKEKVPPTATPSPVPADSAPLVKKENVRKESPPRNVGSTTASKNATSSFLGLLADMEKKPEKEPKKEVEVLNETPEERDTRLRKEARRRLRVSWKADAELVEVRTFTHDPEEEIGDGDSLRRDAGDTGREGEALKLHKDRAEVEDDEDEDAFEELEPYTAPSEVDFTALKDESPLVEGNSLKFGGSMKPESPSSEAQDKREQDTVMTTYASKADRPSTPKEPDDNEEGDFEPAEPETAFGEPTEKVRQREKDYLARQSMVAKPISNTMPPATDLAAQIQALSSGQVSQQPSGPISAELQRVLSALGSGQPAAPQQTAPGSNVNFSALLQSVQQVTQQLQGQNQQPQYPALTQAPAVTPNLSALLASMQQPQQSQSAALPLGSGGDPNPYPGSLDDASRKHGRTDSNDYDAEHGRKGGFKKKKGDQSKPYNYKTQICSFWEQGKCLKGDACTYRHGNEDA